MIVSSEDGLFAIFPEPVFPEIGYVIQHVRPLAPEPVVAPDWKQRMEKHFDTLYPGSRESGSQGIRGSGVHGST